MDSIPTVTKRRLFATVVGIDCSKDFDALSGAVRDAELVFDALERTRLATTEVVAQLIVSRGEPNPNKEEIPANKWQILAALRETASLAAAEDTVLIYFAGHGVLLSGQAALVPSDADRDQPESFLGIGELQSVFADCACGRRIMLLDACQTGSSFENLPSASRASSRGAALAGTRESHLDANFRPRGRPSGDFLDHLALSGRGWVILTSCGPGQCSWETDELDSHGIFSYYVALGLRGEADTDKDGTIGLFELAQYVSDKVADEVNMIAQDQMPQLIASGPMLSFTDKGAVTGDALRADHRELSWSRDLPRQWSSSLRGQWPFEPTAAWNWVLGGVAFWYGAVVGTDVFMVLDSTASSQRWLITAVLAILTGVLWFLVVDFAIASALCRYHDGGYIAGSIPALWQLAVFLSVAIYSRASANTVIQFGISQFILLCIVILLGCNATFSTISLLDLERRKEEQNLRRFFRDIGKQPMRVAYPNVLACEAFHPRIYLWVGVVFAAAIVVHIADTLWVPYLTSKAGLVLLHDAGLLVLVAWLTSSYITIWYSIQRRHPKLI